MTKEEAKLVLDSLATWEGEERMITAEHVKAIKVLSQEPCLQKDLDEVAEEFAKDAYPDKHNLIWMFKRGVKWQAEHTPLPDESDILRVGIKEGKRQMMKKAVEGRVRKQGTIGYFEFSNEQQFRSLLEQFKDCDKIRIIVVKEDSHE